MLAKCSPELSTGSTRLRSRNDSVLPYSCYRDSVDFQLITTHFHPVQVTLQSRAKAGLVHIRTHTNKHRWSTLGKVHRTNWAERTDDCRREQGTKPPGSEAGHRDVTKNLGVTNVYSRLCECHVRVFLSGVKVGSHSLKGYASDLKNNFLPKRSKLKAN